MKKRSGKNLINFFYHLLVVLVMAMPMLSGLVRVIYVQSNQNAFESYSGTTYKEIQYEYYQTNEVNSVDDLVVGNIYTYSLSTTLPSTSIFVECEYIEPLSGFTLQDFTIERPIPYFKLYANSLVILYVDSDTIYYNNYTFRGYFYFVYSSSSSPLTEVINNISSCNKQVVKNYIEVTQTETLDNAFDYSLWWILNRFTFHSDFRFTDIANGMLMTFDNNNLYIQYINFYINWVLTCAVISFAPYVLLTFYHLAIGLLDKFMKKGDDL